MKRLLLIFIIALFPFTNYAQLGAPNIISYPCFLAPGVTGVVVADSVTGATVYEWVSTIGSVHAIWFPFAPGPAQTSVPSINIQANSAQQVYEICVRAINAIDTSVWTCIQIMGVVDPPVMLATNSPTGIPGDSGYYAIVYPNICPPAGYTWTITGDATFNNGTQNISTTSPGVNVNFGPNFTSGTLCVTAMTAFGLSSLPVCMVITAPVGINEPEVNFSFVSAEDKVIVELSSAISEVIHARIFDSSGRCLTNEAVSLSNNQNHLEFSTAHLQQGVYFLELASKNLHEQFRFVLTE